MTERDILIRIGTALYGDQWQLRLARELGVSGRSVRYWLSGGHAIPPGVWDELRTLLIARRDEIAAALAALEKEIG